MATKKTNRRARRPFTIEQKLAIVAEIGPQKTMAAVARKHGVGAPLLAKWRKEMDGRPRAPRGPGRPATVWNGHAPVIDAPPYVPPDDDVRASLDQALADIERAGKTIAAIREAARKVFGLG